jgi:hypothetical protein
LKETSLQVSFLSILGIYSWKVYFIGLSKRGMLYIFRTLYDTPEEAMTRIDLRSVDARVVGTPSSNIIKVFNGDVKFYLKFQTIEEFSSWLRQLSDFGVSAAVRQSNSSVRNSPSNHQSPHPEDSRSSSQQQRNPGETDDFSSTFGM